MSDTESKAIEKQNIADICDLKEYLKMVKYDASIYCDIPIKYRKKRISLEACKACVDNLAYVPHKLLNRDFFLSIIKEIPHVISKVPNDVCTDQFYVDCIKANEKVREYVPDKVLMRIAHMFMDN